MHPLPSAMMLGGQGALPGYLYVWGQNTFGSLGNGGTTSSSVPTKVGTALWLQAAAGDYHTVAVRADGTLWGMGRNNSGQLGDGTLVSKSSPVQIGALSTWRRVYASGVNTIMIKEDGTLWGTGSSAMGPTYSSSPIQIGAATDWYGARIAMGGAHMIAVKRDGTLWAMGVGTSGQLGRGTTASSVSPVQVGAGTDWACPGTARNTSAAIKQDGTLWTWGQNTNNELGTYGAAQSSPVQVGALTDWLTVSSGPWGDGMTAVKTGGSAWAWGDNTTGQLGDGTTNPRNSPVQIGALTDWIAPASIGRNRPLVRGRYGAAVIKSGGTLWATGRGPDFGTQTSFSGNRSSPVQVGAASGWHSLSVGMSHMAAIKR
ncbi:hypothetical protein BH10PSE5_BH10PSE5_19530 [soil metagenome]